MKYYLAAPYDCRGRAAHVAKLISEISGWRCASSWIAGNYPGSTERDQAEDDLRDLRSSSALVLWLPQPSTAGGLWVEMGYALGMGTRVVVVATAGVPLPVFCAVDRVRFAASIEAAARYLATLYRTEPEAEVG